MKPPLTILTVLLLSLHRPCAVSAVDYPYITAEPQKTGWPLTAEERAYVVEKPVFAERPNSTDVLQKAHPPDCHPLGQVDISVVVETCVVGMNEFSWLPAFGMLAHGEIVGQYLFEPGWVVAEVSDDFVGAVEQCDSRVQIGHEHHVAAEINGGGEQHVFAEAEMLSFSGKILQPRVGPIRDNQRWLASLPIVPPQPMRRTQLAGAVAKSPEMAADHGVFVVLDDVVRAVPVADPKTAVWRERDVRWAEQISLAVLARRFHLERFCVFVRSDLRRSLFPDNLALQCALGDIALVVAEIEEFLGAVTSNIDPVSASVKFSAERADELAVAIEYDHSVLRVGGHCAMFYIDQAFSIDSHTVRILPANVTWDLHAIVMRFVPMAFRTNDRWFRTALIRRSQNRRRRTSENHAAGRRQESAS